MKPNPTQERIPSQPELAKQKLAVARFMAEATKEPSLRQNHKTRDKKHEHRDEVADDNTSNGGFEEAEASSPGEVPIEFCREKLSWTGDIESCQVRVTAAGAVAVVNLVTRCNNERCDVRTWLKIGESDLQPLTIDGVDVAEAIVSADTRFAFVGQTRREGPTRYVAHLWRAEIGQDERPEKWADCAAPVLSPSGRWIVCRTQQGHVARVTADDPTLHMMMRVPADLEIDRGPSDRNFLIPVRFVGQAKVEVVSVFSNGTSARKEIEWIE